MVVGEERDDSRRSGTRALLEEARDCRDPSVAIPEGVKLLRRHSKNRGTLGTSD